MTNRKSSNLALVVSPDESSLSDQAYSQIEEMIVTMQLPPETPVSEAQLSNFLGIGRTPIREAIQRLSREHLVTIVPKRGIFISHPTLCPNYEHSSYTKSYQSGLFFVYLTTNSYHLQVTQKI